jgi:hypothetical protein
VQCNPILTVRSLSVYHDPIILWRLPLEHTLLGLFWFLRKEFSPFPVSSTSKLKLFHRHPTFCIISLRPQAPECGDHCHHSVMREGKISSRSSRLEAQLRENSSEVPDDSTLKCTVPNIEPLKQPSLWVQMTCP